MKDKRQSAILNLIATKEVETQEELVQYLESAGFKVTQATISRDIRELKLTKVATKSGVQKYVALTHLESQVSDKIMRAFRAGFLSMEPAQNILVIKTLPGMGNAVAAAVDAFHLEGIVGTLAGDDTVFCAISELDYMAQIIEQLNEVLS
jgi:transcriptional regulator of arginine metabolism